MTALLMQQAGYDCIGVNMKLQANSSSDATMAARICEQLGIPFYEYDLATRFKSRVVEPFVRGYVAGETPNPCIMCNRHMKFASLLEIADELGCEYLATGHYARVEYDQIQDRWFARTAADASKDQSYVLYTLKQEQLSRVVLPLGTYCKTDIRKMAAVAGLPNADQSDSQDICFIPGDDYATFIEDYQGVSSTPGDMLDRDGAVVGQHKGLIHYTIGQRKGLGAHGRPVFVRSIDACSNTLTIDDDPSNLLIQDFIVRDVNWLMKPPAETIAIPCTIKIGYNHLPKAGVVFFTAPDEKIAVNFEQAQRAITPGQAAVFYDGDTVIGGGTIDRISL